jgi:hypothetical protein
MRLLLVLVMIRNYRWQEAVVTHGYHTLSLHYMYGRSCRFKFGIVTATGSCTIASTSEFSSGVWGLLHGRRGHHKSVHL